MPDKRKNLLYSCLIILAAFTVYLGYFVPREETIPLMVGVGLMFAAFFIVLRKTEDEEVDLMYYWSILLRVLLIASIPKLSDDVYRFIWDGRLLVNLQDPYKYLPAHYLSEGIEGIDYSLFELLNSSSYYSVYPPLNQVFFFLSTLLSPNSIGWSIVILRVLLFVFELGNIRLIRKLLAHYNLPEKYGLLYALNPLVIFELTGNLHFEGVLVFFLLLAILKYEEDKLHTSAIYFGLSVATKFIPLILLPLLFRKIGFKKTMVYGLIVAATVAITFLPLINTAHIWAIWDSAELYFQKFEFNGSFYYLAPRPL